MDAALRDCAERAPRAKALSAMMGSTNLDAAFNPIYVSGEPFPEKEDSIDVTGDDDAAPPSTAKKAKKRKASAVCLTDDVPTAAPTPIGAVMVDYLAKKNDAASEELRLKAERQTHDMQMEKDRAAALLAVEVRERDAKVAELLANVDMQKAQAQQSMLIMQMFVDMQKPKAP